MATHRALPLDASRVMDAIDRRGSFAAAADELGGVQPALGQHIRTLEAELDVSLLERHSRGVTPTPAGQRLYARGCEIFELIDRTQREVKALGCGTSPVTTLGLSPSLTLLIGADLQLAYGEHAPGGGGRGGSAGSGLGGGPCP